ncbi:MAG: hypothetical protein WCT29_00470 [Candidatus Paceibacterota bacterium]|jgi:hypothetical protein
MKEFIKKNFAILLAFILPVLLIVVVVLVTYIPSFFVDTNYNFIYVSCGDGNNYYSYNYECAGLARQRYSVENNRLVINPVSPQEDIDTNKITNLSATLNNARIFLHNTEKNESREITLAEAQMLTLNGLITAPDGVTISSYYQQGDYIFPFGGSSSSYGYYLTKGKGKQKLNLVNTSDRYYYRDNFEFIGWVLPGRN